MSKADYYRPSRDQIRQVARCSSCGREREYDSDLSVDGSPCYCGAGRMVVCGESYPASADDWDEERDPQDGEWRRRR